MRVLMLGAPGSGKGTHGARVAAHYGVPHVSTGALLREQIVAGSELGRTAQPLMARGDLVPDDLILSMVVDRLTNPVPAAGYVLDGFPRTLPQATAAYEVARAAGLTLDAVVFLEIGHDELIRRLAHRGRTDDTTETIIHRIDVYEEQTLPLLDYYDGRAILHHVDAVGTIDEVTARVLDALDRLSTGEGQVGDAAR
jgi:adenylate kinase